MRERRGRNVPGLLEKDAAMGWVALTEGNCEGHWRESREDPIHEPGLCALPCQRGHEGIVRDAHLCEGPCQSRNIRRFAAVEVARVARTLRNHGHQRAVADAEGCKGPPDVAKVVGPERGDEAVRRQLPRDCLHELHVPDPEGRKRPQRAADLLRHTAVPAEPTPGTKPVFMEGVAKRLVWHGDASLHLQGSSCSGVHRFDRGSTTPQKEQRRNNADDLPPAPLPPGVTSL